MLSLKGKGVTILNSSSSRNLNLCSSLGDAVVLRQKLLPLKDILIVVIIIIITYKSWLSSSSPSSWNLMFPKLSRGQVQIDVFSGSEKLVAPDDENTAMCHGGPQMTFQMFRYNVCPNLISHPYQEYFLIFSIYQAELKTLRCLKRFDIEEQNLEEIFSNISVKGLCGGQGGWWRGVEVVAGEGRGEMIMGAVPLTSLGEWAHICLLLASLHENNQLICPCCREL